MFLAFFGKHGTHVRRPILNTLLISYSSLTWLFLAALLFVFLVQRSNPFYSRSHATQSDSQSASSPAQQWIGSPQLQPSAVISVTAQPTQTNTQVATFTPMLTATAVYTNIPIPIGILWATPTLTVTATSSLVSTPIPITSMQISTLTPTYTVVSYDITSTATLSQTPTLSPLPTSTLHPLPAATSTVTSSLTVTQMPAYTNTLVPISTPTLVYTLTATATLSPFPTPTIFLTATRAVTNIVTNTVANTTVLTGTPIATMTPTPTVTILSTGTPLPTLIPSSTVTPTATIMPTLIVTYTPTPTYTTFPSPTSTATSTATPTSTAMPAVVVTPTLTWTSTPTPNDTVFTSPTPLPTATDAPTVTPLVKTTDDPVDTPMQPTSTQIPDTEPCIDATLIPSDGTMHSLEFVRPDDLDLVYFKAEADVEYLIEASALPGSETADLGLELYHECDGEPLKINQDFSYTRDIRLTYSYTNTGSVYLKVTDVSENILDGVRPYNLSVYAMDSLPEPGAIVILASRLIDGDPQQFNIDNVAKRFYDIVYSDGAYPQNQIMFLTDNDQRSLENRVSPAKETLRHAITEWAPEHVGENRPFTLYIVNHGDPDRLYIDKPNGEWITPNELDSWLDQLETAVPNTPINIIIESSNSGSFITGEESISKPGRMIITSAGEDSQAYSSIKGAIFSDFFLNALDDGSTVFHSYTTGLWAARQTRPWQSPGVDADGNGKINEPEDYILASRRGLLYDRSKGPLPLNGGVDGPNWGEPFIVNINNTKIEDDLCTIEAIVRDDIEVKSVWAIIYEPSFDMPKNDGSLGIDLGVNLSLNIDPELSVEHQAHQQTFDSDAIIHLSEQGNDRYKAERDCVRKGRYRIVVNADDKNGNDAKPVGKYLFNHGVYLPIIRN